MILLLLLRIVVFLTILGLAVNAGVEKAATTNPGFGVVWGILFFVFWYIVAFVVIGALMLIGEKIGDFMDEHDHSY